MYQPPAPSGANVRIHPLTTGQARSGLPVDEFRTANELVGGPT
jgi:hypothetical protein